MPIRVQLPDGRIAEFPDGMPEAEMAQAIEDVASEQQVRDRPPSMAELDMGFGAGGFSEDDRVRVQREGRKQLPVVGALLGGGPIGAGIGAAAGKLAERGLSKGDIDLTDAKDAAITGGATAAGGLVGGKVITAGLRAAAPPVQRLAQRFMKSAIKADRGYLEKMAGSKHGGIAQMEDEIVDTALSRDINPVTRKGMGKVHDAIDDVSARRTTAIRSAPNAPIAFSGGRADRAALKGLAKANRGDAPQDDIAAVENLLRDLRTSPKTSEVSQQGVSFMDEPSAILNAQGKPVMRTRAVPGKETSRLKDLTPTETAEAITAGNERLRGLFSGTTKNAEIQARLGVQRARTESLDQAANTKPLSNNMRRLIDLRNVGNIALRRADASNPVSITDVISLSAMHPTALAGSVGMKSANLGRLAVLLNKAGRSAGKTTASTEKTRSLLASLMASHQKDSK